jgi:mannose-6-phosphate isomerase-like protein (cupin superfamily)
MYRECIVVRKEEWERMKYAEVKKGHRVVEESEALYQKGFPVRMVQDNEVTNRKAEVHLNEDDLWRCVSGQVTVIIGGKLSDPATKDGLTFTSPTIEGGKELTLRFGDWLLVPAGQPHQFIVPEFANLEIIKLPAKEGKVELP